ncbi:hypothetical protein V8C42DRAFT_326586 [Trichoderma barbatum]
MTAGLMQIRCLPGGGCLAWGILLDLTAGSVSQRGYATLGRRCYFVVLLCARWCIIVIIMAYFHVWNRCLIHVIILLRVSCLCTCAVWGSWNLSSSRQVRQASNVFTVQLALLCIPRFPETPWGRIPAAPLVSLAFLTRNPC